MSGGVALTATTAGVTRPNKLPASSTSTTTPAATNFRCSSSNNVVLPSSVHSPNSDTCDNRQDSSLDSLFVSVPSETEVQAAIVSLLSLMQGISLGGTALCWLNPLLSHYDPTVTQSLGLQRLKDSLYSLETDQSIQRLVLSISSDKSVWDAVLKNKLVQELRESHHIDEFRSSSKKEEPGAITSIKRWILEMVKAKVMELLEKFRSLVDEIFESASRKDSMSAESRESLEEKLKSSVLLSIVILLVVIVTCASHLQ